MYEYCIKNYLNDFYDSKYSFNLKTTHEVNELFDNLKEVLGAPIDVKYFYIVICQDYYRVIDLRNEEYLNLKKSINNYNANVNVDKELLRCALILNGLLHASVTRNIEFRLITTSNLMNVMLTSY